MHSSYLVELSYGAEHSLACLLGSKLGGSIAGIVGMETDNIGSVLPEGGDEPVAGGCHDGHHVVIERVHVLHQPGFTVVLHLEKTLKIPNKK